MAKKKLQRFAENKELDCLIELDYKDLLNQDFQLKGRWASNFFKNTNPIVLELGCGRGEYTIALAKENSQKNYIGIDIKGSRLWCGAKIVEDDKIPNAAFIRAKIDFITSLFAKEIDEIWITFPDPFPDKPNRRLISPKFLNKYFDVLKPNCQINLKTDSTIAYNFAREIVTDNKFELIEDHNDLHAHDGISDILKIRTKYEDKYIKAGKKIKYISFRMTGKANPLK